jgi:hypothetical protein
MLRGRFYVPTGTALGHGLQISYLGEVVDPSAAGRHHAGIELDTLLIWVSRGHFNFC